MLLQQEKVSQIILKYEHSHRTENIKHQLINLPHPILRDGAQTHREHICAAQSVLTKEGPLRMSVSLIHSPVIGMVSALINARTISRHNDNTRCL